jgi:hypothetical protein
MTEDAHHGIKRTHTEAFRKALLMGPPKTKPTPLSKEEEEEELKKAKEASMQSLREEMLRRQIFNPGSSSAQPAVVKVKEEYHYPKHSPAHSTEQSRAQTEQITQTDPLKFIEELESYLYRTPLETLEASPETRSTTNLFKGPYAWCISKSSHWIPTRIRDIVDVKEKWIPNKLGGEYFNTYAVKELTPYFTSLKREILSISNKWT